MAKVKSPKIPEVLVHLRTRSNLTQDFIASQINVSRSAYAYYESGKTEPSFETLSLIAKMNSVDVDVFSSDVSDIILKDSKEIFKPFVPLNKIDNLSKDERELVAMYRIACNFDRRKVLKILDKREKSKTNNENE